MEYLMRFLDEASNLTGNIMLSFYSMKLLWARIIDACLETNITKVTTFMHNYTLLAKNRSIYAQ